MSLRDFLTNVSVILAVMAAAALIETAVPMFMAKPWKHPRRTANLGLTTLSFVSNWLLASVAALAAVWLRPAGGLAGLTWPMWTHVLVGIVILDFSVGYLSHLRTESADPQRAATRSIQRRFRRCDDRSAPPGRDRVAIHVRHRSGLDPWAPRTGGRDPETAASHRQVSSSRGIRLWAPLDRVLSLVWVAERAQDAPFATGVRTNSITRNLLTVYDLAGCTPHGEQRLRL
jgi:hypothetical protein